MKITLIAAMTKYSRGIGKDGEIPWHIPEELEHFKEETYGHPVIMGRKTFEGIVEKLRGPLPGRLNIVLSSSESYNYPQTVTARNKQAALEAAEDSFEDEVYIAGGQSVYEQFIDEADQLLISIVNETCDCDAHFPNFSGLEWEVTSVKDEYEQFEVLEYERRNL